MRILFLISLFLTQLFSKNPDVYSALGDVIYDNAQNIEKLESIDYFDMYDEKIKKYIQKVNSLKTLGYKIEKGELSESKKEYLIGLRKLSQDNDFFTRTAKKAYEDAMTNENSKLFSEIINTGLIDVNEQKKEIIDYYFAHQQDINASGVIQTFLEEDAKLKDLKEAELRKQKTKKERELEKIKQIREKDKLEQKALEDKLQKEVEQKKKKLREEQKEELLKTR